MEEFLNKVLSNSKTQTTTKAQILKAKAESYLMYKTVESDSVILAQVKDLMCNMRV